ncbi:MAG: HEAT repeat domain-containing protein [Alphaproteobacteria bacterium]
MPKNSENKTLREHEETRMIADLSETFLRFGAVSEFAGDAAAYGLGFAVRSGSAGSEAAFETLMISAQDRRNLGRSRCAIAALGIAGDRRAVDVLIQIITDSDDVLYSSCGTAVRALGLIGDRRALKPLKEFSRRKEDVLGYVEDAIAAIKEANPMPARPRARPAAEKTEITGPKG